MPLASFSEYEENIAEVSQSHFSSRNRKVSFGGVAGLSSVSTGLKQCPHSSSNLRGRNTNALSSTLNHLKVSKKRPPIPNQPKIKRCQFTGIMKRGQINKPAIPVPPPRKTKKALAGSKTIPPAQQSYKRTQVSSSRLNKPPRPISYNSSISSPVILSMSNSDNGKDLQTSRDEPMRTKLATTESKPTSSQSVKPSSAFKPQKSHDPVHQGTGSSRDPLYASDSGLSSTPKAIPVENELFHRYHRTGSIESNISGVSNQSNPYYAEDIRKFAPLAVNALISSSDFVKKTEILSRTYSASSLQLDRLHQSNTSLASLPEQSHQNHQQHHQQIQQNPHSSSEPNLTRVDRPVLQCHKCYTSLTQLVEVEVSSSDYSSYTSSCSDSSVCTDSSDEDCSLSSASAKAKNKTLEKLKKDTPSKKRSTPLHENSAVSICNEESVVIEVCSTPPSSVNVSHEGPYHIPKESIIKSRERLSSGPSGFLTISRNRPPIFKCCQCNNQKAFLPFLCLFIFVVIIVFVVLIDILPGEKKKYTSTAPREY